MMVGHDPGSNLCSILSSLFTFRHCIQVQDSGKFDLALHRAVLEEVVVDGILVNGNGTDS